MTGRRQIAPAVARDTHRPFSIAVHEQAVAAMRDEMRRAPRTSGRSSTARMARPATIETATGTAGATTATTRAPTSTRARPKSAATPSIRTATASPTMDAAGGGARPGPPLSLAYFVSITFSVTSFHLGLGQVASCLVAVHLVEHRPSAHVELFDRHHAVTVDVDDLDCSAADIPLALPMWAASSSTTVTSPLWLVSILLKT